MYLYDPRTVVIVYGGAPITGFAPSSFLDIDFTADRSQSFVGVDGEVVRVRAVDNTARATIRLLAASPSNLALRLLADETLPFGIVNLDGTTIASASRAWISRLPEVTYDREVSTRVWQFTLEDLAYAQL